MRFIAFALLALSVLLIFPGIGDRDFWPGDEARYGGVARDMAETGHYSIPFLNGEVYGDKPPGYFWSVHMAAWITGEVNEQSARWPAAFAGVVLVILVAFTAARATGAHAGFLSGLSLLALHSFAWQTRFVQLDLLFAMFIALGCFSGFRALERSQPRLWMMAFLWLGLAMLVKGPLALLALLVLAAWRFLGRPQPEEKKSFKAASIVGVALLLMPCLLWLFFAAQSSNGLDYITDDLIERNIVARSQDGLAHVRPWHFYLVRVPINLAPWGLLIPILLSKRARDLLGREGRRLCGFCLLWVLIFLILQSAFPGKRNVYTFIFYAPLAILIGHAGAASVSAKSDGFLRTWTGIVVGLVALLTLTVGFVTLVGSHDATLLQGFSDHVRDAFDKDLLVVWRDLSLPTAADETFAAFTADMRLLGLALIATGIGSLGLILRGRLDVGLDYAMLGLAVVLALGCTTGAPWLDQNRSRRALAEKTKSMIGEGRVAIFRHTDEGILWYMGGRLLELTGEVDLAKGTSQDVRKQAQLDAAEVEAKTWLADAENHFMLIRRKDRERLKTLVEGRDYILVHSEKVGSKRWYDLIRPTKGD